LLLLDLLLVDELSLLQLLVPLLVVHVSAVALAGGACVVDEDGEDEDDVVFVHHS
jgi:hypothetical protein